MIKIKNHILVFITALFVVFGVLSCKEEKKVELVPKDNDEVTLNRTETITVDSVEVTVSSDSWVGAPEVRKEVTPVRITITNNNDVSIKVAYSNIKLIGENGTVFHALPIYNLISTVDNVQLAYDHKVVVKSEIEHDGFSIYPLYTRVYTDIPITNYKYFEDPGYYTK